MIAFHERVIDTFAFHWTTVDKNMLLAPVRTTNSRLANKTVNPLPLQRQQLRNELMTVKFPESPG